MESPSLQFSTRASDLRVALLGERRLVLGKLMESGRHVHSVFR